MTVTWTTRDGLIVPIKEMTDTHLINCIAYLFKEAAKDRNNLVRVSENTSKQIPQTANQLARNEIVLRDVAEGWAIIVSDKMPHLIKEAKRREIAMPVYYTDRYITRTQYYGPSNHYDPFDWWD